MSQPKCVRIEMEYDDGTVYRLEGEEAEKAHAAQDALAIIGSIHGVPYSGPTLKRVEKP